MNPTFLYVLQLQGGKYYVGVSQNPEERLHSHRCGNGTEWTRLYPPVRIYEQKPTTNHHDENNRTIEYMKTYGIDHVRGGIWTKVTLSSTDRETIQKMMDGNHNLCYTCHQVGHYASQCPYETNPTTTHPTALVDVMSVPMTNRSRTCITSYRRFENPYVTKQAKRKACVMFDNNKEEESSTSNRIVLSSHISDTTWNQTHKRILQQDDTKKHHWLSSAAATTTTTTKSVSAKRPRYERNEEEDVCFRCGRSNHKKQNCFASTHIVGYQLHDNVRSYHEDKYHHDQYNDHDDDYVCYRCGRSGHFVSNCFATYHVDGNRIKKK
jgi:predicted GIY-YIG superfamily endonuclease